MMHHTEVAVLAILRADPTVDAETIRAAVAVLKGRAPAPAADAEPVDRAIPRSRVAEILGVKPHTVSDYARKGLLVPFRMGERGQRARCYSAQSVNRLMERCGRAAPSAFAEAAE